jgi:hypothetical protein
MNGRINEAVTELFYSGFARSESSPEAHNY